jgi:hypothetical protein
MIFSVPVSIKEIVSMGRDFPWNRPSVCPRCGGSRVWGHGFVGAFFDGFSSEVMLKRYRCPDCHCVLRLKPAGYFKRFQAPVEEIRSSIAYRLQYGRWPNGSSRARQSHWLRALYRKIVAYLGKGFKMRLLEGFDYLTQMDEVPVSRRI